MTDDMELKPCPFCGGGATLQSYIPLYDDAFVCCDRCEIEGPRFGDSNEKAIAAWNTRADLSQAAVEALEAKLAKAVEDRDEVLNQLDSARHSVDVLEKRVESLMNGETHLQKSPAKPISGDI